MEGLQKFNVNVAGDRKRKRYFLGVCDTERERERERERKRGREKEKERVVETDNKMNR